MGGRALLAAVAAVAATLVGVASAAPASQHAARAAGIARVSQLEADVLARLNVVRREHHLGPLRLSSALTKAADEHSRQMGRLGYFEHESADGTVFWKRVARFYPSDGFGYWSVGENLLWSSPDVDGPRALELWMASPEHRDNILTSRWREVGVAAVKVASAPGAFRGLDVTIVTTDFGIRR